MRKFSTLVWFAAFALFSASQHSLAETTDVSGRWIGRTTCPLGTVVFSIDVKGTTGTFSHGGYGPNKVHPLSFPVTISKRTGWEGEWVYFKPADPDYRGSFDYFNGLLAANGRQLTLRPGVGLGGCRGFSMTRSDIPSRQPSSTAKSVAGPPHAREPTEEEMQAAVKFSLHGDSESLKIDNPLNGATISIDKFEKLNCEPHKAKPGYFCDYIVATSFQFHSNEGTAAGNRHADAVQALYDLLNGGSNASEGVVSGRFLYVRSKSQWMKFND